MRNPPTHSTWKHVIKVFARCGFAVVPVVITAALVAAAITAIRIPLPYLVKAANTPLPSVSAPSIGPSTVLDINGNQIDFFQSSMQYAKALTEIPQSAQDAVIAVEDATFYQHKGVSVASIVRAAWANHQAGSTVQGGSTITQQVVKNLFLSSAKTSSRKVQELVWALQLEDVWSKDQILERYMNIVYMGHNSYGFPAAARLYFNKEVSQLTPWEGAFLAGIIRSPGQYDPIKHPAEALARFKHVLKRLVVTGHITKDQEVEALATFQLPTQLYYPENFGGIPSTRTHFTEMVKDFLVDGSSVLGDTREDRIQALYTGGLTIYTTFDPATQAAAEQARLQLPQAGSQFDVAITSLDNSTGAVKAIVGGPGFQVSQVNLALAPRQTGSSVKAFVLAAAYAQGIRPYDLIDGKVPCTLPNPQVPTEPFQIEDAVSFPLGPLETATWKSSNCAFAKLSQVVGLDYLGYFLSVLGASSPINPYPAFVTGANEISTFDMATMFATLANGGVYNAPYTVEKIVGPTGKILFEHVPTPMQMVPVEVANETMQTLKGVLVSGTGRTGALANNRVAAGKTGTQENNTNAWFVGATPQVTTAVWVGDPNAYTPMVNIPYFAYPEVQGGTYPVLIWKTYMDTVPAYSEPLDWGPGLEPRKPVRLFLQGLECTSSTVIPLSDTAYAAPVNAKVTSC